MINLVRTSLWILFVASCGAGTIGGIHARMGYSEEGGLRVVDVPRDGPAYEAGIREGDRIATIDGEPVRSMSMVEVVEHLRGPVGSDVTLEVVRGEEFVSLRVERASYASTNRRR